MSRCAVAHLDDVAELDDGREPYRPVRHHFAAPPLPPPSCSPTSARSTASNTDTTRSRPPTRH
jgi:hypothetical protein